MKAIEISGTVYAIGETQVISPKFRKRELILTIDGDGKYPQTVAFESTNDHCEHLDDLGVGDEVAVEFYLRGREWTSPKGEIRYFNSLPIANFSLKKQANPKAVAAEPPAAKHDPESPPIDDDENPF